MKQLEDEWAAIIGKKRFEEFLGTLRRLSGIEAPPVSLTRHKAPRT
ncbi:MAG TPA: hypothetical protein VFA80_02680 [Xanthobacteraceae bacterium]|jgi:hypothetical protein|nr:hypothetical protein [Xanthobacteraceae bacterium]